MAISKRRELIAKKKKDLLITQNELAILEKQGEIEDLEIKIKELKK